MSRRLELSGILHEICDNIYFQPPPGYRIKYPCIIYERRTGDTIYADNRPYHVETCYTVTVIDTNPDSEIPDKVGLLPKCKYDRTFSVENLYHHVFILYY